MLHVQWLALPQADSCAALPLAVGLHGARPAAAAHGREARPVAAAALALRPRRRPHEPRARRRSRELGVEARVIPHPVYPSAAGTRRRRPDAARARRDPAVQGARRRGRGRAAARRTRGCSWPAIRRCRSTGCATRRAPSGGSATCRRPSSTARSRTRRSRSSRTAPSSTSRARCCRRSAPASRRSPTTSAASPSRSRATAPGASCPRATSRR